MTQDVSQQPKKVDYIQLLQRFAFLVLRRWYLVVFCVLIGILISFLINRYSRNVYLINSSLLYTVPVLKERGSTESALAMKQMLVERSSLELIRSRNNFAQVFDSLDFRVSYQAEGNILVTDLYPNIPFAVEYDTAMSVPSGITFALGIKGKGFTLTSDNDEWSVFLPEDKEYFFEVPYVINGFNFTISRASENLNSKYKYYFTIKDKETLIDEYRSRLQVSHDSKTSMYYLSMSSYVPQKDAKFMNMFINVFLSNAKKQKYESSLQSIAFIDQQVKVLTDSLFSVNRAIGQLRLSNVLAEKGVDYVLAMADSLERMKRNNDLRQHQRGFVRSYIENRYDSTVFSPPNINLNNTFYNSYVSMYSGYVLSKKKKRGEEAKNNPLIAKGDSARYKLEGSIDDVFNTTQSYEALLENIQEKNVKQLMTKMPTIQELNDKIAQLQWVSDQISQGLKRLLEQRTEAQLTIAQTTSDYKIYDEPTKYFVPISPDRSKNKSMGLFIGLLLPIGFIVIRELLHPYIKYKAEIQNLMPYPIVGTVNHSDFAVEGKHVVVADCPRTQVSESLRAVRAALMYMLSESVHGNSHVILISSSVSGEGKSMVSSNLAALYAMAGKRTLLIDADMRRPTIRKIFRLHETKNGLSDALVSGNVRANILSHPDIKGLDILCSGAIPPNPFELLSSTLMSDMIEKFRKEYDYIIIDTPPVLLVSDARPLMQLSDVNVLVVRFNKTLKSSLTEVKSLLEQDATKHVALVFNDIHVDYARYSGKYYGSNNKDYYEYYTDVPPVKKYWMRFPWS